VKGVDRPGRSIDSPTGNRIGPPGVRPELEGLSIRQRFTIFASAAYIVLGAIIVVRSVEARVFPLIALGAIFVALGLVKIRDLVRWRRIRRVP